MEETFESGARAFVASRRSRETRRVYSGELGRWLDRCRAAGADPSSPPGSLATSLRDEIAATSKPGTVRLALAALSSIYADALARGTSTGNPFSSRALPRPSASLYAKTAAAEDASVRAIVASAEADPAGARDAALIRVLAGTGLRRSSVARLRRDDVVRRGGQITALKVTVKGGKEGEVEVVASVAAALERWIAEAPASEWVFPKRGGGPISPAVVNKVVTARSEAAGVGHVHPHQLRARFITKGLDKKPLHEVQAAVHHASPATTLRYDRGRRGVGVAAAVDED